MRSLRFWRLSAILSAVLLLGILGQSVIADESGNPQDNGASIQAGIAAIVSHVGGTTAFTAATSDNTAHATSSLTYVGLIATSITVPAGQTSLLTATFSAESVCVNASSSPDWCTVRIVVFLPSGAFVELNPVAGSDFAFDSTDRGRETDGSWEGHAITRFSNCLPAGTYRVVVQYAVVDNAAGAPVPTFRLDDYALTVTRTAGCGG